MASGSPQRKRLLEQAGYSFEVVEPSPTAECGICSKETPGELVARLARQKAIDVREQLIERGRLAELDARDTALLACDTVAECLAQVVGKPVDIEHARRMHQLLSGRDHRVYSGLCLWWPGAVQPTVRVARTTLQMEVLGPQGIEDYLATGQWQGKAGGFGFQDRIEWLRIVEGSESNVIGLPLELLAEMLAEGPAEG